MRKRRKRRKPGTDIFTADPADGLEINRANDARLMSKRYSRYSIFDADNICVELDNKINDRRFHHVSVFKQVKHANASKTKKINGYKEFINSRRGF